jgi:hypothetical protein
MALSDVLCRWVATDESDTMRKPLQRSTGTGLVMGKKGSLMLGSVSSVIQQRRRHADAAAWLPGGSADRKHRQFLLGASISSLTGATESRGERRVRHDVTSHLQGCLLVT